MQQKPKERPILLSEYDVGLIRLGKTQMRRLIKPQPKILTPNQMNLADCPYGRVGDILWVREPWCTAKKLDSANAETIAKQAKAAGYTAPWAPIEYKGGARDNWDNSIWGEAGRWRPAVSLPRWGARLVLEIKEVRAERLSDLTSQGLAKEGFTEGPWYEKDLRGAGDGHTHNPTIAFRWYWASVGGQWADSYWVWVVTFRRLP